MKANKKAAAFAFLICVVARPLAAQSLSLQQAIDAALKNYPSIRVTEEQMNAAAANIRLAQTAYLPRADALAQVNRATRNTFYGLLLPNSVIPGLDGSSTNNLGSVWDSGAGLLVTWQPFDFGLRSANLTSANAAREYARATLDLTRFDVAVATADAFLTVIAAQETAKAAEAAVNSWETLRQSIHALVAAKLRPGADESRVQSELAIAHTQLIQANQAIEVARTTVSQFVGTPPAQIELQPGKLLEKVPPETQSNLNAAAHPLSIQQRAQIAEAQSQLHALERTYRPQFSIEASAAARGTGLDVHTGERLGGWNGLAPTAQNYAVGFNFTFPFMDIFAIREQEAAQAAKVRAEKAQSELIDRKLQQQWEAAQAALKGARAVAANTPVEVSSAETSLNQANAQYKAGLTSIDTLAQAERLLVQAEIDDALARLNVWRALLQVETVQGDIRPFAAQVDR